MEWKGEESLILAIFILVSISIFIVFIFFLFVKRKNNLLQAQKTAKQQFEQEISKTQIEIREQTLRNISWELHDNVGQLLTLAKIQLQNSAQSDLNEVKETIGKSLNEIRSLSKAINPDVINNLRLNEAVQLEIDRFNRLDFINATLQIQGEIKQLKGQSEIIIFRILQEFFSNTMKHAQASKLDVLFHYSNEALTITAQDNGVGFDTSTKAGGIGLQNMKNRCKLINAKINIISSIDNGTQLKIIYYF